MNTKMKNGKEKRVYEKPALRTVELSAGEVLAVGCKMPGQGANFGNKNSCTAPATCSNRGS